MLKYNAISSPLLYDTEGEELENKWTLWFDKPTFTKSRPRSEETWKNALHKVGTVETIEEFWRLLNTVDKPTDLPDGYTFYFFKGDAQPSWEEPPNLGGGKWTFVPDTLATTKPAISHEENINNYWEKIIMAAVGENLSPEACGIVFNKRKAGNKISLWTTEAADKETQIQLGKQFLQFMGIPFGMYIRYTFHADSKSFYNCALEKEEVLPEWEK